MLSREFLAASFASITSSRMVCTFCSRRRTCGLIGTQHVPAYTSPAACALQRKALKTHLFADKGQPSQEHSADNSSKHHAGVGALPALVVDKLSGLHGGARHEGRSARHIEMIHCRTLNLRLTISKHRSNKAS